MKYFAIILVSLLVFSVACSSSKKTVKKEQDKYADYVKSTSGLLFKDVVVGNGPSPKEGQTVVVHYVGTFEDGNKFDSSRDRGRPFEFRIGVGSVIKGWDEGVMTMKKGGTRKLVVPPHLGYGSQERGTIPANSTLLFEVELIDLK